MVCPDGSPHGALFRILDLPEVPAAMRVACKTPVALTIATLSIAADQHSPPPAAAAVPSM